jgi:glycosyltransferase involved in cell wall biosynthesis
LFHSRYKENIKIFGKNIDTPISKNFNGIPDARLFFKSKNKFLAEQMVKSIKNTKEINQLLEIHNRPYLVDYIYKNLPYFPIFFFFHNDPQEMKGSKTIRQRENLLKKCEIIFCVSEYIKKRFLDGVQSNHPKVKVLYNGVNRNIKKMPIKKNQVLFVGRLVKEKGIELFINVVKKNAIHFPDWNFIIAGSSKLGELDVNGSFASKISNTFLSIGKQAILTGFITNKDVQRQMQISAIIVIPSLWEEPFGLVAAEAMSNGMAIIASKVGGIPEVIGKNGILIENINENNLEEELKRIILNNDERSNLQKLAWQNFNLDSKKSSFKLDTYREEAFKKFVNF